MWSEDPTGPVFGGFTAVKIPVLTAGLWVKTLLLFPLLKWAIKAWRKHGRGFAKWPSLFTACCHQNWVSECKTQALPKIFSRAGNCIDVLVTAPISSKFRLSSQLTSGKYLRAPVKAPVTHRLGPSKKAPKSQNHHNFHQEAHGRKQKSKDKRSELCLLSEITHWARCTYTRDKLLYWAR